MARIRNKDRKLVVNRWMTPDGTYLQSRHTHDYVEYVDKNGETYMVDGGSAYIRTSMNKIPMKCCCLYDDDPISEIRKYLMRGTFNSEGRPVWVPLCEMSDDHVKNCITYNEERGFKDSPITECYRREVEYRLKHGIKIEEKTYDDYKVEW